MLFLFALNVPLAEFISMLWVIILQEYKSLTYKPWSHLECSLWVKDLYLMLQYDVIAGLIQFALHLVQIPQLCNWQPPTHTHPHTHTLCFTVCVIQGVPALSPTFHCTYLFICPKDFIPLLYCALFVCHWPTGAFWHYFTSSTVVSWQQFCHVGQLHRVFSSQWIRTHFFMTLVQLCCDVWSSQPSFTQAGDWWNCLLLLLLPLVYEPYFCSISWCLLAVGSIVVLIILIFSTQEEKFL